MRCFQRLLAGVSFVAACSDANPSLWEDAGAGGAAAPADARYVYGGEPAGEQPPDEADAFELPPFPAHDASEGGAEAPDAAQALPQDAGHGPSHDDGGLGRPDVGTAPPPPPGGRMEPPPLPGYSGGECPRFTGGPTNDTSLVTGFPSGGDMRSFRMLVPPSYDGSEPWPVMFAWHWLNADSSSFVNQGELESAAEEMGVLVVLPDHLENANGDKTYFLNWPFAEIWGADKELQFFDDMLACVDANFNIDPTQIHGIGVSAGALWVTHLASTEKADHFASITSLSGGLGRDPTGVWNMMYAPRPYKFPAIVLWGGPSDNLIVVDFQDASIRLKQALIDDHHFVVSCTHDSGHAVPPIDRPADGGTRFRFLWRFMLDHPYGLPPGASPWQRAGLPPEAPPWCEIATP